nr:DUF2381 family protein [Myxococcus sp. RHSTA-1-4]
MLATGAQAWQVDGDARRIDTAGRAGDTARELRVAPGVVTSLVFDTPLDLEAMKAELEGLGARFGLVDVGQSRMTMLLRPSAGFSPGSRQRVEVRFSRGEEPRRAVLELVSVPKAEAERQVEVTRQRPPEEGRVAALEARGAACEAELEAVKARSAMPLAMLVLEGGLKPEHPRGGRLLKSNEDWPHPEDMELTQAALYRTKGRAALSLRLSLALGSQRWTPGEAVVEDARTGRRRKVHGVAMNQPALEPGAEALLVVEWEATSEAGGIVDVRVLEREGARHVGVGDVEPGPP